jgi:hypothetical protein
VSLDKPTATTARNSIEKHQYSQRKLELMNRSTRQLERVSLDDVKKYMPFFLKRLLLEHDTDTERMFRDRGEDRDIEFISCLGIVRKDELMEQMKEILQVLQEEYSQPVDIEFTINFSEAGDYVINILQCRPLQVFQDAAELSIPENLEQANILFECRKSAMGLSRSEKLDVIVYVDPVKYYSMPYQEKNQIARAIGRINWEMRGKEKHMLLMVPGRVGTTSPELGVPTAFSDISEFDAVCEIADSKVGYNPELSYGSHFFQDLVESGILYNAIFENEKTLQFDTGILAAFDNKFDDEASDFHSLRDIIAAYDVSTDNIYIYHDMKNERTLCARI